MALSDKVLQANKLARRVGIIRKLQFDKQIGSIITVTLQGVAILEVDTAQEATDFVNLLNNSLTTSKNQIITDLEAKISGIINA